MSRPGAPARSRGPLGALAGVPGVTGALVRAAVSALVQTVGTVLLAAGIARAVADVAGGSTPGAALVVALAGVAVRTGAQGLGAVLADRDARRAEDTLRSRLLTRLLAGEGEAVTAAGGTGPAAVLVTTRLHDLGPALAGYLPALAATIVVPPVLLVVLGITDWLSALLVGLALPLVPVFMALVGLHTRDRTAEAARALDRIAAHVAELVRGLPVLVGLGRAADELAALAELGEAHRRRTLATLRIAFLSSLVLELLATLSVALVAVTVGLRLTHGTLDLGVGLFALLLAPEAFAPLRALGAAHHASETAAGAAAAARDLLATPAARPVVVAAGAPGVAVRELAVRFPGRALPALDQVCFTAGPGELIALSGPSGSGKSTALAVLAGQLLDGVAAQVSGSVAVGVPVAVLPQFPHTVADTVLGELLLHAGDLPEEQAVEVAAACLQSVLGSHLRDRTCRTLSPGELQRVALARALVRVQLGATVLLLDEPTASLDADATELVAELVAGLRGSLTIVLVSHEPVLAALADRTVDLSVVPLPVAQPTSQPTVAAPAGGPVRPAPAPVEESGCAVPGATVRLSWPRRVVLAAVAAGVAASGCGIALTALSGWLIVRAAEQPNVLALMLAIVGVRAAGLGRALLRWVERLASHDAAFRLGADTRVQLWRALVAQGPAADRTPGRVLARVVGDVGLLQELSVRVVTPPLVSAVVLGSATAVLAVLLPPAGLAVGAVLAAAVLAVLGVHRRADRSDAGDAATLQTVTLHRTSAVLSAAGDLRAHGLTGAAVQRLDELGHRQGRAAAAGATADAVSGAIAVAASGCAAVLALAVAGGAVRAGVISAPVAAVLALTPLALLEPLTALGAARGRKRAWDDARGRVAAVLAEPVAADPAPGTTTAAPAPVTELAFRHVTAGWPGRPAVLGDLDLGLDLAAGRGPGWLVVTGPSGSGKSTLLAVLMAALRPTVGEYLLGDGSRTVSAARLTRADVQAALAWCPQDAHVFDASLRGNLALARVRGELAGPAGEQAMRRALTDAGLGVLLASLPAGLDTPVGAGGTSLSGGERRRLAVARALLADRDVVLLDEPTAHLDPPTAAALVADLRRALAGRVVVCVTHDRTVLGDDDVLVHLGEREPALSR